MKNIIVFSCLHVFAEDHQVGFDGYMACLITIRLAVIAMGVGLGQPGWLYRERG